jgi:chromosome segregation ATPase
MLDNSQITAAVQADIDAIRERYPRTADLYREACGVMFFRYGLTPTANSLYQFVRKGSMSVPSEALRRFWSDLRERARVDLQHADLPDQVKHSAGQLVGEIWSLARQAADESVAALQQSVIAERETVLAEKATLENQVAHLSLHLENARTQIASVEATVAQQREELGTRTATERETDKRLVESRAEIERLQGLIDKISAAHVTEIDNITGRVALAERRYTDLEKRTLVDLDRERTTTSKLQKQLDAERKASAARIEGMQSQVQAAQFQLARQSQELGGYIAKTELLADERDRAARQAADSTHQSAELGSQLAAELARVIELRARLEQTARKSASAGQALGSSRAAPHQRRPARGKPGK